MSAGQRRVSQGNVVFPPLSPLAAMSPWNMTHGNGYNATTGRYDIPLHPQAKVVLVDGTDAPLSGQVQRCSTLALARAATRQGTGDWLLLPAGSTLTEPLWNVAAGGIDPPRRGLNAQYPFVIGTFDPSDKFNPAKWLKGGVTFDNTGIGALNPLVFWYPFSQEELGNVAFVGITFKVGPADNDCYVQIISADMNRRLSGGVLFDGCVFDGAMTLIQGVGARFAGTANTYGPIVDWPATHFAREVTFHRCGWLYATSAKGARSGNAGEDACENLRYQHCINHHGGWSEDHTRNTPSWYTAQSIVVDGHGTVFAFPVMRAHSRASDVGVCPVVVRVEGAEDRELIEGTDFTIAYTRTSPETTGFTVTLPAPMASVSPTVGAWVNSRDFQALSFIAAGGASGSTQFSYSTRVAGGGVTARTMTFSATADRAIGYTEWGLSDGEFWGGAGEIRIDSNPTSGSLRFVKSLVLRPRSNGPDQYKHNWYIGDTNRNIGLFGNIGSWDSCNAKWTGGPYTVRNHTEIRSPMGFIHAAGGNDVTGTQWPVGAVFDCDGWLQIASSPVNTGEGVYRGSGPWIMSTRPGSRFANPVFLDNDNGGGGGLLIRAADIANSASTIPAHCAVTKGIWAEWLLAAGEISTARPALNYQSFDDCVWENAGYSSNVSLALLPSAPLKAGIAEALARNIHTTFLIEQSIPVAVDADPLVTEDRVLAYMARNPTQRWWGELVREHFIGPIRSAIS